MAFSTSIRAIGPTGAEEGQSGRGGGGGGRFTRDGGVLIVTGNLSDGAGRRGGAGDGWPFGPAPSAGTSYRATFKDVAPGTVEAEFQITSRTNTPMQGVFFVIALPDADYAGGSAQFIAPTSGSETPISLGAAGSTGANLHLGASAKGVRVTARRRQCEVDLPAAAEWVVQEVRTRGDLELEVSFPLNLGNLTNGQKVRASFTIKATGEVDQSAARLVMDPSQAGRPFDGMGGNFRLQSPADAAQIQYNLDHLRVAWGRVAMPLDRWQPKEDTDPVAAATNGTLNSNVRQAMEMARKLAQKNIPTVISLWFAPSWALATNSSGRRGSARINPSQWDQVCQSIGSYLEYMRANYSADSAEKPPIFGNARNGIKNCQVENALGSFIGDFSETVGVF